MDIGVLYLFHAMLILAELIVCSTRGFACILAKWFWPTVMSPPLTYGRPEASCKKRAETYGIRSVILIKEFWTLCILSMTVIVESIPWMENWSYTWFGILVLHNGILNGILVLNMVCKSVKWLPDLNPTFY